MTHDRAGTLRLADRVAVLLDGRLAQVGSPETVFGAPVDEVVARFVGVENLLPGQVAESREGLVEVQVAGVRLLVAGGAGLGERVLVGLRPEDLTLAPPAAGGPTSAQNRLVGRVIRLAPLGALCRVVVDCGLPLTALVTRPAVGALGLAPDATVSVTFKATAAHLIRRSLGDACAGAGRGGELAAATSELDRARGRGVQGG